MRTPTNSKPVIALAVTVFIAGLASVAVGIDDVRAIAADPIVVGAGITAADEVIIYSEDFETGGGGFYTYAINDGSVECIGDGGGPVASRYSRAGCNAYLRW